MKNSQKKQIDKKTIEKELQELEKNADKQKDKKEQKKKKDSENKKPSIEEYYDPSLKPKSTIYYEEKGAKISDVKITTLDGEEVNVLVQGREYFYKYKVNLNRDNHEILCAMLIKNTQGVNLVQGIFFINCGVSDKNGFLHRIIDSYSIKVIENNTDIQSFQIVDFNIKAKHEA